MFRLFPKKKKSRFHSFSALFVQRKFAEFSANEIRGEKKKREEEGGGGGRGEGGIRSRRFCRWRREPSSDVRMRT